MAEDREAADTQVLEVEALAPAEREADGAADAEDLLVGAVEGDLHAERREARDRPDLDGDAVVGGPRAAAGPCDFDNAADADRQAVRRGRLADRVEACLDDLGALGRQVDGDALDR